MVKNHQTSESFQRNDIEKKLNEFLAKKFSKVDSISKIKNGLGVSIVSTSKGIMSDNDARMKNIGGEIICRVF